MRKKTAKHAGAVVLGWLWLFALLAGGCRTTHDIRSTHEIRPVEVKPIHITIDVNIRVDRALDNFFADLDREDETILTNE